MSRLTAAQRKVLLAPIREGRVGKDGKGFKHVEAYEIRAHLSRIFDFCGWSADVLSMDLIFEDISASKDEKPRYTVAYRAQLRLTIYDVGGTQLATYTEWATGEATNQPSRGDAHDLALKTAESQALKRAAANLGDSFGLSLYRKGSTAALVQRLVVNDPNNGEKPAPADVDAHITESVPESELAEPAPDNHTQSEPPKEISDEDKKALRVADLTAQLRAARTRSAVSGIAMAISKEKLHNALTDDGENVLTLGALADSALKRVAKAS